MQKKKAILRLYGAFSCRNSDGQPYRVSGHKHRALLAMLATAADGTHTRGWLQDALWGRSDIKNRRESLRRALADLRKIFAEDFDQFFTVTNIDVGLVKDRVALVGDQSDGIFLEGIEVPGQGGFLEWLEQKRSFGFGDLLFADTALQDDICPTLAVVPFLTESNNLPNAHFSDLVTLEITRNLTRSRLINVISHLSSRRFSGPMLDLLRIRSALQIDYLVHGTLRCENGEFRLDADFIHTKSGKIYWSRTYTGRQSDLLAGDNALVRKVSSHIGQAVLKASAELANSRPLPRVDSHALFMSAIADIHSHRLANFSNARHRLEQLIQRCPDYSVLHAWLAKWYILSISQGWSNAPDKDIGLAHGSAQRALDINANCALSLTVDGMILSNRRDDLTEAGTRFEEAVTVDPNNALAWLMYARMHAYRNDGVQAVKFSERARALSPLDPYAYFFDSLSAMCHVVAGNLGRGYELISKSLVANPNHISTHRAKTITLQLMGRDKEANAAAQRLMRLEPGLTIQSYIDTHPAGESKIGQEWGKALREAGIPLS